MNLHKVLLLPKRYNLTEQRLLTSLLPCESNSPHKLILKYPNGFKLFWCQLPHGTFLLHINCPTSIQPTFLLPLDAFFFMLAVTSKIRTGHSINFLRGGRCDGRLHRNYRRKGLTDLCGLKNGVGLQPLDLVLKKVL